MKPAFALCPLLLSLLAGCSLGPDFSAPDSHAPAAWPALQETPAASQAQATPLEQRWWESFHDPKLSALIERASQRNLDLQIASARLLQSRALRMSIASEQTPSVDLGGGYSRARNSAEGLNDPSGNGGKSAFNLWQGDFTASWELDLWGRVRRQVEAADAVVEVAENDRRGVLLSLLAETAGNYIQLRAVQSTLAVTRENLEVSRHSLRLSQMRLRDGVATALDVAQASAQVASVEARLPTLEERQAQLINALGLLLAEPPRSLQAELLEPGAMPTPQQRFAIGVPSELAERRPDILQAEAQLHAATASIGVAKADFYPSIRLSGNVGLQSLQLSDFGSWDARRFAIGPQLNLPIFEGGRLRGVLKLREAQQQEAALRYQQVVLRAWHEIDDVLRLYNASQLRRDLLEEAVRQNRIALQTAQQQYVEGAVDFLNVLSVQGALLASQEQWVESSAAVSQALVGLYKSLGGGWQPFSEPLQAAAQG
ncbi:efflux transporter outer membrane subunit [Pseudomonas sp. BIGb0427]|uniref:efflux transporter outer membrane subunit n=1 Tax=unclassified Pseudomonas TaxID=196821 RepID=UPI0018A6F016|nr:MULTISPECIES: efflux transporter outer membrane subunit [unclassified Pseudomonas]QPG63626.1 efflux transporter outer membrane subunit [Pseudomonas sp. BIGb0427]UVM66083.1 efflux transporter outer membrane subunit [Pseudomonas sp. B21-009]